MFGHGRRSRLAAISFCTTVAGLIAWAASAQAYAIKLTPLGLPVRWPEAHVGFVVDRAVDESVSGGVQAVTAAVGAWHVPSAPALTVTIGQTPSVPAVDGQNSVIFAANGFLPAGNALAITLVSFDAVTGDIVDTDIVVNGIHAFSVLPSDATPPADAEAFAMEGGAGVDDPRSQAHLAFDLQHVVAHEVGHALGLADSTDSNSALMYPYTKPNDASVRGPAEDDTDGISDLYSSGVVPSSSSGCGANVAGAPVRSRDAGAALALAVIAGAWVASRRRAHRLVPFGAILLAVGAGPLPAHSAERPVASRVYETAHVVGATTEKVGGVFQTTLDLVPTPCSGATDCPRRVRVWGGTIDGITQAVDGAVAPRVDDDVDVTLAAMPSGPEPQEAFVIATRTPSRRP